MSCEPWNLPEGAGYGGGGTRLALLGREKQSLAEAAVQGGRIVQRGTHAQLAGVPGLCERLYRTQFANQAK